MEQKNQIKEKPEEQEEKKVSLKKLDIVGSFTELMKNNRTIMVASLSNLSYPQLQKIKKTLKDKAIIKVAKKNLILLALEKTKQDKKEIEYLEKNLEGNFAILFTQEDPYKISSTLADLRTPGKVKAGQIAPQDIYVEPGPTDLPAGPIISELSKVGIKAGIGGGKITIKERAIITKSGETITADAAIALTKLEISPFSIGLEPIAAYDTQAKKIYIGIKIDKEAALKELKLKYRKALNLALVTNYITTDTILFLIAKAAQESNSISSLIKKEKQDKKEEKQEREEKKESENNNQKVNQDTKQENKE